jgi:hypothetical protein
MGPFTSTYSFAIRSTISSSFCCRLFFILCKPAAGSRAETGHGLFVVTTMR